MCLHIIIYTHTHTLLRMCMCLYTMLFNALAAAVLEFIIIMWEYFNSVCCVYMRLVSLI